MIRVRPLHDGTHIGVTLGETEHSRPVVEWLGVAESILTTARTLPATEEDCAELTISSRHPRAEGATGAQPLPAHPSIEIPLKAVWLVVVVYAVCSILWTALGHGDGFVEARLIFNNAVFALVLTGLALLRRTILSRKTK